MVNTQNALTAVKLHTEKMRLNNCSDIGIWVTVKQKILTLYSENIDIIDSITDKFHLKRLDEQTIASFVKLRNGKTHSGTIEWGNCADYYMPLLAIAYSTLFRYAEIPEELIKQLITSLF